MTDALAALLAMAAVLMFVLTQCAIEPGSAVDRVLVQHCKEVSDD